METKGDNNKHSKLAYVDRPIHEKFRKYIKSERDNKVMFYILCQLTGDENVSTFSAVKFISDGYKLDNNKYCVKFISKEWVGSHLDKFKGHNDFDSFYNHFYKSFPSYKNLFREDEGKASQVIELEDFLKDEDGIYTVTKYAEYTLKDYVNSLHKSSVFEKKVRKLIEQIFKAVCLNIEENKSLCFGGFFNSNDIMVQESSVSEGLENTISVKFPNPFMAEFFTIVKMYDPEQLPCFYAPELFEMFESDGHGGLRKSQTFDLSDFLSAMHQPMDIWSLGCMLYEILFDDFPFKIGDIKHLKENSYFDKYSIYPKRISKTMLDVIDRCLKYEKDERLPIKTLNSFHINLKKENQNLDDVEKDLKKRAESEKSSKPKEFSTKNDNELNKYD
jgi:serine/threonine protein kinase